MKDDTIQAYFEALGLDAADAWTLFKLIDTEQNHQISIEEFIQGCMRLRGGAKGIDSARLVEDNRRLMKRLLPFMSYVENCLEEIAVYIPLSAVGAGAAEQLPDASTGMRRSCTLARAETARLRAVFDNVSQTDLGKAFFENVCSLR
eukprot:NODE_4190_length_701_cov_282.809598.p1 GENE.NODE_4190_length_701_cov_282.809598~~NODE_4190_length_701_cov_282.809598.p1  ORF type:complete len:147 (+),score=43.46 NODE_4190_length_701_cov_282.809598:98-538(+)